MGDFDYRRGPVGHCTCGTAATFDEARADFEAAWRVFLSKRTEVDFQEWRDQRDWTARKYAHVGSRRRVAVAAAISVHLFQIARLPAQVQISLPRAVEPKGDEVAFPGIDLSQLASLPGVAALWAQSSYG
jgi:hypothetical protein